MAYLIWLVVKKGERECSYAYDSVDAIVPAYNEEVTIARTVMDLLANEYIRKVIVVDDGSTDQTSVIVRRIILEYGSRVELLWQPNTGKAGRLIRLFTMLKRPKSF